MKLFELKLQMLKFKFLFRIFSNIAVHLNGQWDVNHVIEVSSPVLINDIVTLKTVHPNKRMNW